MPLKIKIGKREWYPKDSWDKHKKWMKPTAIGAGLVGIVGTTALITSAMFSRGEKTTVPPKVLETPAAVTVVPSNYSPQGLTPDDYADPKNLDPDMTIGQAIQGKEACFEIYKIVQRNIENVGYVPDGYTPGYTPKAPTVPEGDDKDY